MIFILRNLPVDRLFEINQHKVEQLGLCFFLLLENIQQQLKLRTDREFLNSLIKLMKFAVNDRHNSTPFHDESISQERKT